MTVNSGNKSSIDRNVRGNNQLPPVFLGALDTSPGTWPRSFIGKKVATELWNILLNVSNVSPNTWLLITSGLEIRRLVLMKGK